jgi:hypothetical protein
MTNVPALVVNRARNTSGAVSVNRAGSFSFDKSGPAARAARLAPPALDWPSITIVISSKAMTIDASARTTPAPELFIGPPHRELDLEM